MTRFIVGLILVMMLTWLFQLLSAARPEFSFRTLKAGGCANGISARAYHP